jgi:hypothetical protein
MAALIIPTTSHEALIADIRREIMRGETEITSPIFGVVYPEPTIYRIDLSLLLGRITLDDSNDDHQQESAGKSAAVAYWGTVFGDCISAYITYAGPINASVIRDLYEDLFYRLPAEIAEANERREIADTFYTHAIDDETGGAILYSGVICEEGEEGEAREQQYHYCIRPISGTQDYRSVRLIQPYSGDVVWTVPTFVIDSSTGKIGFICPESEKVVEMVPYYENYEYCRDSVDSVDRENPDAIRGRHLLDLACHECHQLASEYHTAFDDLDAVLRARLRNCFDDMMRSYLLDCIETREFFTSACHQFGASYYDARAGLHRYSICIHMEPDAEESDSEFSADASMVEEEEEDDRFYYRVKVIPFE